MFKLIIFNLIFFANIIVFAVCDSGYAGFTSSTFVTGVVTELVYHPPFFSAGTCYPEMTIRFATLTENGVATTCMAGTIQNITASNVATSIGECQQVAASILKILNISFLLGKKISLKFVIGSGFATSSDAITLL